MSNQKTEKLGLKKSLSYGMGAIGEGIGYNFFYSYFIFFMINIAGVNPAVAGTVSLIAVFWDAVTDPIIGSMSDRCRSKRGAQNTVYQIRLYIPRNLPGAYVHQYRPACRCKGSVLYPNQYCLLDVPDFGCNSPYSIGFRTDG